MSIWWPIGANGAVYGLSGGCEALLPADATLAANVRLLRLMLRGRLIRLEDAKYGWFDPIWPVWP